MAVRVTPAVETEMATQSLHACYRGVNGPDMDADEDI